MTESTEQTAAEDKPAMRLWPPLSQWWAIRSRGEATDDG